MRREREMQRKTQKRGADAKADAKAREATFAPLIHALLFFLAQGIFGRATPCISAASALPEVELDFTLTPTGEIMMGRGAPPQLPSCHLCGRQFGTTSLGIHLKACKRR